MFKNKKIFFFGFFLVVVCFFYLTDFVFSQNLYGATDSATKMGLKIDSDLVSTIGNLIGVIFSFVSVIFFILIIYAGILWMTARGNDQQTDKAKQIIIGAVAGIILIVGAYSITNFVFDNTDFNVPSENKFFCDSSLGWQCEDLAYADVNCRGEKITGTDFYDSMMAMGGTTMENCNNSEYCKTTTENCLGNQVCCQPYKTGCEDIYGSDYNCVDDTDKCTDLNTVKYETGLCEQATQVCCLQKNVWCLDATKDNFECISETNCKNYGYHILPGNPEYFETKNACEDSEEFTDNKQVFCFYEDTSLEPSEWKCEPINQNMCKTTKNGFPFETAGDCSRALDTKFGAV